MRGTQGSVLILLAAVLWGTTGTSQALMPTGSSPLVVGTLRIVVGGAALIVLCALRGRLTLRGMPLVQLILAGFFVALYQASFFWAVSLTGVAAGTIVGIGSSPLFAGLLDWWVQKRSPGPRWYLATLTAISGCALLILSSGGVNIDPLGIVLALVAGCAFATYTLLAQLMLPGRCRENVTALMFTVGALLLLPLLWTADLSWLASPKGFLPVLHLGLVATAFSYWLFTKGLAVVPAANAVTLSLAEPMTAGLLGVLVLGERLSPIAWGGLLLILAALVILVVPGRAVRGKE
jgi:DME family drug/metabolite transporter